MSTKFQNITYSNNRDIVDFKKITNVVMNSMVLHPIRTRGCFPPGSRFSANNFRRNKGTQSKLGDFS